MKLWKYPKVSCELSIASKNPLLAKLLAIRKIDTDEKAEIFLNPEKKDYLPFSVFKDSKKVLERIKSAVEKSEKIIIYGDFDTDGVTSTAILYKTLMKIGANVGYYLPDRDSESHGLNNKAILTLISKQKAKLIITVDCGISNTAEVKLAQTFKTDVIITDHHEAPENLPEAYGIINPKAENVLEEDISSVDIESLCCLSGAGISFKLSSAILREYGQTDFIKELEPIAALGTIGDIVPLIYENRRIAYCGIKAMQNKVNKGLTKLFENAAITDFSKITSETVAFTAVPRINATGRLEKPDMAFRLLISDDSTEIETITRYLNELNTLRQNLCEDAFHRAEEIVQSEPEKYKHSIVICDENAHIGIIGLSASRLVEKYAKPSFVMRKDENIYRCSCRGLQGVNIFEILNQNKDLFLGFGGHEFAGGFSFDGNVVSFEKVREAIDKTVREQTNGKILPNILNIDLKITPNEIDNELVNTVRMLEPCGAANPVPVFAIENLNVAEVKFMGQNQNHLKLFCKSQDGDVIECIKWSTSDFEGQRGDKINIAFTPDINEFNGKTSIQLYLKDMILPDIVREESFKDVKIIDCRQQKGGYDKIYDFLQRTEKSVFVFAENKLMTEECHKSGITDDYMFTRYKIPAYSDMVILAEMPPSLDFLRKLLKNNVKEMLFMNYEMPFDNEITVLMKIAGMLKYTFNSKNGISDINSFIYALNFDEEIFLSALQLFQDAGMIDFEIQNNDTVCLKKFNTVSKENMKKSRFFEIFKRKYLEYFLFADKIQKLPQNQLKEYICR